MKYLIVGLGNIGAEYANTRHNIGFKILDAFAKASNVVFRTDRLGDVCEVKERGRTLILLKPSTYMNLSGKAVAYWMQKEGISIENLFILVDDIAIPFGAIRIRKKGSDGGHNGLKNINAVLGHSNYNRLRFGIGSEFSKGAQIDYVLGEWNRDECEALPQLITHSIEAAKAFTFIGIDRTMNTYNK